jgi:hypothetical protein
MRRLTGVESAGADSDGEGGSLVLSTLNGFPVADMTDWSTAARTRTRTPQVLTGVAALMATAGVGRSASSPVRTASEAAGRSAAAA